MKNTILLISFLLVSGMVGGCSKETKKKDRSDADEMFKRIISLTSSYIAKIELAPDSAEWVELCRQFEDSLDRINFSYPPDTDILLTEGQNDTIQDLLKEFIVVRDKKINEILYPVVLTDSIESDSLLKENISCEISR